MARTVRFYDDRDLLTRQGLALVPGPVEKLGEVALDGMVAGERHVCFAGSIIPWQGGWRLYYSDLGSFPHSCFALGLAESEDGLRWRKIQTNRAGGFIHPEGLPESENLVQPQAVILPDGRVRIYFWWHGHQIGRARYLAAESDNGLDFTVVNRDDPCLFHPSDFNVGQAGFAAGLTAPVVNEAHESERTVPWPEAKRRRSNDATFVYYNERLRIFEMYSVWLAPNDAASGHYTPHDNAPQIIRVMHRRTSEDGLLFSDPELILIPDESDPLDLQFYHLAVQEIGEWRLGMLGHYRCWAQTMDLELCFSRDGRQWERPLRGGFIPRGGVEQTDHYYAYPTSRMIPEDDNWLMLYDGGNYKHNSQLPDGVTQRRTGIFAARVPQGRFAGLRTTGAVGSLELKCIPSVEAITVNAAVRGRLRAELRDIFGRPLPGYHLDDSVAITGDSATHVLRWGAGQTSEAYQFDAVRLRLEIADGTLYSLSL